MDRIADFLRGQLVGSPGATDRHLLDRFLLERDEAAFAELVRRHGPLVWGACRRRLTNPHDAEDAFQATFLVLVRRAACLSTDVPLGPWLHRVAVMTARNVARGNRRRAAVSGPMEDEVPAPDAVPAVERLDLDAALLALPERYRAPVLLCHLQGLSRREAAARLGCPEGTLSSLLSRALARLRVRLGGRAVAGLAVPVVLPTGLSAATVRTATIYTTSIPLSAGVSPTVAGLTNGVLRMFWLKKVATAVAVLLAGGVLAAVAVRSEGVARATDPALTSLTGDPQQPPEDPDAAAKRIDKLLDDLQKQKQQLDATMAELVSEKARLEEAKKAKAAAAAAAELGTDIAVVVGDGKSPIYTIREVVNGKVAEVTCHDLDMLRTYLARVFNDPKGPKKLRVSAYNDHPVDQLRQVFAACATAGYTKATFSQTERPVFRYVTVTRAERVPVRIKPTKVEEAPKPGEIDLKQYSPKK